MERANQPIECKVLLVELLNHAKMERLHQCNLRLSISLGKESA